MDSEPDPEEAARRLRAAIAYVGMTQDEAAKALGVSVPTLARMTGRKGTEVRPSSWGQLWKLAKAVGLPRAWFTADMTRLHEIVPEELPSFANDTGDFRLTAAHGREAQALRREAQRSSARQSASRSTKRAPKRHRDGDG